LAMSSGPNVKWGTKKGYITEKKKRSRKWKIKRRNTGRGGGQCCELAIFFVDLDPDPTF
jgi:hypothetical protein